MKKVKILISIILSLVLSIVCLAACNKSFEKMEGQFLQPLFQAALSRNTLIHISVSQPKGWKIGDETLQSLYDFPSSGLKWDYAAFSHPSSQSVILIFYKPIIGKSYFLENPERFAQWYKETHFKTFKRENKEVIEGSEEFYLKEIEGRSFYVIQNEIFTRLRNKRIIYIFLHIPGDMKSLYTFCFSTTKKKHIEESEPFQDFIKMVSGFKINQIDAYDEALYRVDKTQTRFEEVKWYNAIQDESIEELKNAIAIRPKAWEPHYMLAEIYRSSYLLTDKEEESLSEVERNAIKQRVNIGGKMVSFLPSPINAEAAIREYKEVIKLGCPKEKFGEIYDRASTILVELKRYDEAISFLEEGVRSTSPVTGDSFAKMLPGKVGYVYLERGRVRRGEENYDAAIQDYKKAIANLDEKVWGEEIWGELGEIYAKKGMKKEAMEAYSKGLEILRKDKERVRNKSSIEKRERELEMKLMELKR